MDSLKRKRYNINKRQSEIQDSVVYSISLLKGNSKKKSNENYVITTKNFIWIAKMYVPKKNYQQEDFDEDLSYSQEIFRSKSWNFLILVEKNLN